MRPKILYSLLSPVSTLKGVGDKTLSAMDRLNLSSVRDVLYHKPVNVIQRYDLQQSIKKGIPIPAGEYVTLLFTPSNVSVPHPNNRRSPITVVGFDPDNNPVRVSYFKAAPAWVQGKYKVGQTVAVSGKHSFYNGNLQITHPDYVVSAKQAFTIPSANAVYPLTYALLNSKMSSIVQDALKLAPELPEWIVQNTMDQNKWLPWHQAIKRIHNPEHYMDIDYTSPLIERLAYDELLAMQVALYLMRENNKTHGCQTSASSDQISPDMLKIMNDLPYQLTNDQQTTLIDVLKHMHNPYQMNHLIQGDVGAGKTVVALLLAMSAINQGYQVVFMAPTEVLAKQHYHEAIKVMQSVNIKVTLLTGAMKAKETRTALAEIANGESQLIIGTHAVFQEKVIYKNIGFVIIDEQHRFGVKQRFLLSKKGNNPDVLMMTATPIPRTLMLSKYGDINTSLIKEKPAGRKDIVTTVLKLQKLDMLIERLKENIKNDNTQIYWVCPLVEENETLNVTSVEERFEYLQQHFPGDVEMVHGQLKSDQIQEKMNRFKNHEVSVLLATTVIEVGVNVPNASFIIIENSERFGLSQLHQLRGRVGRGDKQSYCVLLCNNYISDISIERLNVLKSTNDGFVIAEKDLELRGGGEILGSKQSGEQELKIANFYMHNHLYQSVSNQMADIKTEYKQNKSIAQELRILLYLFGYDELALYFGK